MRGYRLWTTFRVVHSPSELFSLKLASMSFVVCQSTFDLHND